jgi:N-acetylmuramoyl-L-alanine amidase
LSKASDYLIGIDDGHGIYDPTGTKENPGKRTPLFPDGSYILEDEFNKPTSIFFEQACKRCGFRTIQLAPEDYNVPLATRTNRANQAGCNIVVSWHFNAFNGVWDSSEGGISTFYTKQDSFELAKCVHKYLLQGTPQENRGIRYADFHMCREPNCPAILLENGFMDVRKEAILMKDVKFQKEQAEQCCKGMCEYLGVEYVEENNTNKIKYNNTILGNETDIQNLYEVIFEIIGYKVKVYSQNTDELTNTCIAIGGTGATNGITDINLNGATRIFGTDREETKQRIKEFLVDKLIDNKLIEENKQLNIKVTELENKIKNAITELQ